jgi:dTMP kinase
VDVEVGLRRKQTGAEWNRMDAYDLEFHRRVRLGFLKMARSEPQRWVIVNAGQPPEAVQAAVCEAVLNRLNR